YKKTFLWVFAILGCITSVAFFIIQVPSMIWLTVILAPLGWSCYNVSSVFSNAFLPIYARIHPRILATAERLALEDHRISVEKGGDVPSHNNNNLAIMRKAEEQITNDLAAWCSGAANVGSMVVQLICIGISLAMNDSYLSLQIAIAFTGVWWLLWTLAVMPWLDARPGPPLPKGQNWIAFSWKKTFLTDTLNNAQATSYQYPPSSIESIFSTSQEKYSSVALDDTQQPMISSSHQQLQQQQFSPPPSPSPHPPSIASVAPPSPPPGRLESNTNVIPLRKSEVWAWYIQNATYCSYGWVSAVLMVPVLIQDLAARNGVETSDHSKACDTSVADYKCVMPVFGPHYLDPGTVALYISSFSALVSFVISLSISPIADYG
ncbi:Autophagy protein 22, partial [Podila verticillata]